MKFGYWRDPLFLTGCASYAVNRWLLKPHFASPILRGQFNDFWLIPCALPLMLWLQRQLGCRRSDDFPSFSEIAFHLLVWSVLFELFGPRFMRVTGDFRDVIAYAAGAAVAGIWWRWRARKSSDHEL